MANIFANTIGDTIDTFCDSWISIGRARKRTRDGRWIDNGNGMRSRAGRDARK